uniref:OMEGA-myrmeciitoxin(02)-Mg1a n=1 Tax=Myrmecia gulosa TaxID=36170 RepID=TX21A_MYRGU|nr:RecName: Full=OMEGA-myrmeciitoxin(02)-Mg1a; Short=MIITX2-Mg1a; Short=OMEGA-MIITX(02)-Mg1a; Flags: Precursor [Myrmecia gulosa]
MKNNYISTCIVYLMAALLLISVISIKECTADISDYGDPCSDDLKDYCIHGDCFFLKELNQPACRCYTGYYGSRCEHIDHN